MNILIIEDDEIKREQLFSFLTDKYKESNISSAKSLQSGLRAIISNKYDLIILDMSLPTYDIYFDEDGGRPQAYAGREILRQMDRREINMPVIVVTQFDIFGEGIDTLTRDELDKQLHESHHDNYKGMVYYNPTLENWKNSLLKLMSM